MIRVIVVLLVLSALAVAAYRVGYTNGKQQTQRDIYAEQMATFNLLYAAAERGQINRVKESLGLEAIGATLWYEWAIPDDAKRKNYNT